MDLSENKDIFQTIFDSVSNGIAVLRPIPDDKGGIEDFSMILCNSHMLKWIGDSDYEGKKFSRFFPMAKENGFLLKFKEVAETGISANFETVYSAEGLKRWIRFTAVRQADLIVVTTEDITDRKQTELSLTRTLDTGVRQKRLTDSITNNTPDLVYVFDPEYRFTYANQALLDMWGKTAENSIGKGLRENGYEEWHAKMHENEIDYVVANKKSVRGTVSFPHAELGTRVYDYILVPVIDENGRVEAIAGTTRDITDIKRAEEKLRQSETRFRNMIEQSPIAMLLSKDEDIVIESINEPMLRFMNKTSADEVIGKKMLDVLPELQGQPALQTVVNVQKTGIPFRGDEQPVDLTIDGKLQRRYFNFSYDSVTDVDGTSSVLHMAIDATERVLARKKLEDSEGRLRSMINQTPVPTLVLMGDDLVIEQINKSMLEMIGFGTEVIGTPLIDHMPELRGQYIWEQVEKVYKEGVNFDQPEVAVSHKRTGVMQDYYYNISYRPLRENGRITGMIQVAVDVTEQVTARKIIEESEKRYKELSESLDQQVKERTKELMRSNGDLQQFAHVASHDLKEPVRKIKTFVGRLEEHLDGQLDDLAEYFIERIHVATNRMFTMIEGVLAYSTINAALQLPEPVDLNEVIKNIETDLEVALQKSRGTIDSEKLPVIEGAPVLLYQLFYNLINNSIKFTKEGIAPEIKISAEDSGAGFVQIALQDNGIGFEPEHAAKIFDTFTRLNSKDNYEGTGLGLALCKKIAERHGGNITANGSPGDGAIFIVTLPLKQKITTI